ncbi:MAG TPA: ABC transporter substrate-binding protein [Candidatus Krumholzibacteria bacterium]|nr:ABC transporter substrate-binding protein [Candidatus Krumholzibacteria bacterium]
MILARRAIAGGLIALALAGCAREPGTSSTLELALETAPNRLDPAFVVDVAEGEICALAYDGLVGFASDGSLAPGVARDWTLEDGRRYVFHIDRRARFSNGRPVAASDVIASFERVLAPATGSPRAWVLERIRGSAAFAAGDASGVAGLSAPDDSTLVIELDEPFAPFLSMLGLPAARIVDTRAPLDANDLPAGAGPWVISEWARGDRISLVPNPYHARRARGIDGVSYRIIPEAFTRVAEFESGSIDVLEIPDAEVGRFRDDPRTASRVMRRPELRVFYVGLNNQRFTDARVRRALNLAVNVDQIIRVLAGGDAIAAHGSIPPGLAGYRERPGAGYDRDEARRLLAEAGYPDGLSIEIWQRESTEGNRIAEAIQGYWEEAGVHATLVRREWSAFKQAVSAGKVDAFLLDWFGDYPDAENFLFPLFHSSNQGGGGNRAFFSDPEVDRRIEAASRIPDADERAHAYAEADSLIYSHFPWVYLYFPTTLHIASERIRGYRLPAIYLGNDFSSVVKQP